MIARTSFVERECNLLRTFLEFMNEAAFDPEDAFSLQQVAIRAVYHELSSIVEHEVQEIAFSSNPPLSPSEVEGLLENRRAVKQRLDPTIASFRALDSKLSEAFGVSLRELPEAGTVDRVRELANSFKHRKGRKRFEDMERVPDHRDLDFDQARADVDAVQRFLEALWNHTKGLPRRRPH